MASCIYCGAAIPFDPARPACLACDGTCSAVSRFSPLEATPLFCHGCGAPSPVATGDPLCDACKASIKAPGSSHQRDPP